MQQLDFPGGSAVKNLPAVRKPQEMWVQSLGQEDPLKEKNSNQLPYSCLGNPMERSLEGYSPWGRKELGTA